MDKEVLIKNIKDWIHLDEEIKNLQRQIKEKRNEKKESTEKTRKNLARCAMVYNRFSLVYLDYSRHSKHCCIPPSSNWR